MSDKSVLIVSPYFAPQSHAAVFRAHKLAKYLPEHGWKPYVLTVDINYHYNEDVHLLAELPPEVEIVRARYIEPTVRGVRMALGGRDRTFAAMKPQLSSAVPGNQAGSVPVTAIDGWYRTLGAKSYTFMRDHWLNSPDALWTWEKPAIRAGRDVIKRHGIDVIYTTCPPYTVNRIGCELQQLGPRWVSDFRDPASYASKNTSAADRVFLKQRRIVAETLRTADIVTGAATSIEYIFNDMYGPVTKLPIRTIPTGLDQSLIQVPNRAATKDSFEADTPFLVFVGEIMPDYGTEFFRYLAGALARGDRHVTLLVVGHEQMNRLRLSDVLSDSRLIEHTRFIDHLPQAQLYSLLMRAKAAVLAPGRTGYWWTLHAKLVDYVGLRKPVLAVVPDPSEARSVLTKANLGIFLDGTEEQATAKLAAFLNGNLEPPKPVTEECDRYLASSQVRSFVDVFESVLR